MHLKLFEKKQLKQTVETTGDINGNKIADKITRDLKTLPLHFANF